MLARMLRVPTRLQPSAIHGLGIFATEPIQAGTVVWDFDAPVDQRISMKLVATLPAYAQRFLSVYGYREGDDVVLCGDDARFMNHSKRANCTSVGGATVAARDIEAGEELLDDYETFDADYATYADELQHH